MLCAIPQGDGLANLQQLGLAGRAAHLSLAPAGTTGSAPTSVTLFDQGISADLASRSDWP
jgi:hypothetical protein